MGKPQPQNKRRNYCKPATNRPRQVNPQISDSQEKKYEQKNKNTKKKILQYLPLKTYKRNVADQTIDSISTSRKI